MPPLTPVLTMRKKNSFILSVNILAEQIFGIIAGTLQGPKSTGYGCQRINHNKGLPKEQAERLLIKVHDVLTLKRTVGEVFVCICKTLQKHVMVRFSREDLQVLLHLSLPN